MSLINEALKKAQHQRSGGPMDAPPMPGGGSASSRAPQGMPKGLLVLLLAGAGVVIVLSVVATVLFVNRSAAPAVAERPAPVKLGPVYIPKTSAPTSNPVVIAPIVIPQPPPATAAPAPAPGATTPPAVASTSPSGQPNDETRAAAGTESAAPTPGTKEATATPAETTPPSPGPEAPLADRIADFVDKVRVMGIRTSDSGSKVLMNDKVYRVNDVVNRSLGLKLTKIEPDSLTFTDANGATYVKNF